MLDFSRQNAAQPKRFALIDGDIVQYKMGFACQSTYYVVDDSLFQTLGEVKGYCEDNFVDVDRVEKVIQAEDERTTLKAVDDFMENILDAVNADYYEVYLTGRTNYREEIDSLAPYKGQRKSDKPIHFDAIGQHLQDKWGAVYADNKEADDMLGLGQAEGTIICTIDKDLDMVPGWHYNWDKNKIYFVEDFDAAKAFYTQLLTGDRVDNILGIKGIGPKKAEKILEGKESERDMYEAVLDAYTEDGQSYWDLLETANLLWIQQKEREVWLPPSTM